MSLPAVTPEVSAARLEAYHQIAHIAQGSKEVSFEVHIGGRPYTVSFRDLSENAEEADSYMTETVDKLIDLAVGFKLGIEEPTKQATVFKKTKKITVIGDESIKREIVTRDNNGVVSRPKKKVYYDAKNTLLPLNYGEKRHDINNDKNFRNKDLISTILKSNDSYTRSISSNSRSELNRSTNRTVTSSGEISSEKTSLDKFFENLDKIHDKYLNSSKELAEQIIRAKKNEADIMAEMRKLNIAYEKEVMDHYKKHHEILKTNNIKPVFNLHEVEKDQLLIAYDAYLILDEMNQETKKGKEAEDAEEEISPIMKRYQEQKERFLQTFYPLTTKKNLEKEEAKLTNTELKEEYEATKKEIIEKAGTLKAKYGERLKQGTAEAAKTKQKELKQINSSEYAPENRDMAKAKIERGYLIQIEKITLSARINDLTEKTKLQEEIKSALSAALSQQVNKK